MPEDDRQRARPRRSWRRSWSTSLLLTAFALQHSVMARPGFKRWWTRFVPPPVERSTYVLAASLLLFAVCLGWRALPRGGLAAPRARPRIAMWALFAPGWLVVLTATFMINHFELFGLRQVWLHARGRAYVAPHYVERLFYRFVRHPIMLGFLIAFWSAPMMSVGHLLFAAVTDGVHPRGAAAGGARPAEGARRLVRVVPRARADADAGDEAGARGREIGHPPSRVNGSGVRFAHGGTALAADAVDARRPAVLGAQAGPVRRRGALKRAM